MQERGTPIDAEFKNLTARIATTLIDLDLMRGEPYFSEGDIEFAVHAASNEIDELLCAHRLTRAEFLARLYVEGGVDSLAGSFIRGVFEVLTKERITS